jgi:hypothetical protein
MITSSEGRRRRQWLVPVVAGVLVTVYLSISPALWGGGAACAATPPGYHWQPAPLWVYLQALSPGLVVFFIGEYVALGARSRLGRLLASALILAVACFVAWYGLIDPQYCGGLLPPR